MHVDRLYSDVDATLRLGDRMTLDEQEHIVRGIEWRWCTESEPDDPPEWADVWPAWRSTLTIQPAE